MTGFTGECLIMRLPGLARMILASITCGLKVNTIWALKILVTLWLLNFYFTKGMNLLGFY